MRPEYRPRQDERKLARYLVAGELVRKMCELVSW